MTKILTKEEVAEARANVDSSSTNTRTLAVDTLVRSHESLRAERDAARAMLYDCDLALLVVADVAKAGVVPLKTIDAIRKAIASVLSPHASDSGDGGE